MRPLSDDAGVRLGVRRRRGPNLRLAIWGLVFFVAATVWTNHLNSHFAWLRAHGVRTTAVLTRIHCSARGGCGDFGWVAFETSAGARSARIALNEFSGLHPGDRIPIAYNPRRPSDARSLDKNASLPMGELLAVMGYVVAFGLWLAPAVRWCSTRRRQRKQSAPLQASTPVVTTGPQ